MVMELLTVIKLVLDLSCAIIEKHGMEGDVLDLLKIDANLLRNCVAFASGTN